MGFGSLSAYKERAAYRTSVEDSVYIAGLSEGFLPISYARTDEAIEEERRLLYVGVTRARKRLCLSWAAGRQSRSASRFLTELQR